MSAQTTLKNEKLYDDCLKIASMAYSTAVKLYNVIREVGHKKLSADNALHQFIEDYKYLHDMGDAAMSLAKRIKVDVLGEKDD